MRQRLGIASALLATSGLLVLDEPTNGLDPQGIIEIRELLLRLNEHGTTVFLSSHVLAEVEALCTRVGIMDRGRLVAQESLDALRRPTGRVLVELDDADGRPAVFDGPVRAAEGRRLVVEGLPVRGGDARLVGAGLAVHEAVAERRTLEDVVLSLTGPGSDRVRDRRRDPQAGPRPRTWVSVFLLCLLPAIVAVFLAVSRIAPRPGRGRRSSRRCSPTASSTRRRRSASCCRSSCRIGGRRRGGLDRGEASIGTLRTCWSARSARTRLLVASSSP
jgi:hypothetical protein